MTPRYRIADLTQIFAYIARDSADYAAGMVDRIVAAIDLLATFPRRQRVFDRKGRLAGEVYSLPVSPYVVFFRISEENAIVRIVRIRHSA